MWNGTKGQRSEKCRYFKPTKYITIRSLLIEIPHNQHQDKKRKINQKL